MKTVFVSVAIASALIGCALNPSAPGPIVANRPTIAKLASDPQREARGYTTAMVAENNYEIRYSGLWTGSRDTLEGALLYRAARLAKEQGSTWFRFLPMPEEAGAGSHLRRPSASFGAAYGHWQPHWSYLTDDGWQPWHPEWGDRFWAERPTSSAVRKVELHAMVELRPGAVASGGQTDFEVVAVLRDLRSFRPVERY